MKFISEKCSWVEWIIFVTRLGNQTEEEADYEEKIIYGYDGVNVGVYIGSLREYRKQFGESTIPDPSTTNTPVVETESEAETEVVYLGFPNWLAYQNLIQCTQT
jgi:hypothetical protein